MNDKINLKLKADPRHTVMQLQIPGHSPLRTFAPADKRPPRTFTPADIRPCFCRKTQFVKFAYSEKHQLQNKVSV